MLFSGIILQIIVVAFIRKTQVKAVIEIYGEKNTTVLHGGGDRDHFCVNGRSRYPCYSFTQLLMNLTSDVTVHIKTTDVVLSSVIPLRDLKNISIIGYNNPTVECGNNGGLQFVSCHNCIIEGIIWNRYGANHNNNYTTSLTVLYVHNSSNITIQNCTFQHSIGQSIVMSEVLVNISLTNCKFLHNIHHGGHGTAITYFSNDNKNQDNQQLAFVFAINGCKFSNNEGASIVFIHQTSTSQKHVLLENSIFNNNQGISIYILNQQLNISGVVLFEENRAENGTGLYIGDRTNIVFSKNSITKFTKNVASNKGGAFFITNHSMILFEQKSFALFNNNTARNGGAAYFEDNAVMMLKGNNITFNNNSAISGREKRLFDSDTCGGAMYLHTNTSLVIKGNSKVTFNDNTASKGGAFLLENSSIAFKGNSVVEFTYNSATAYSGVIHTEKSNISFEGNSSANFINNKAPECGAICLFNKSNIIFTGASEAMFIKNNATDYNGAVFSVQSSSIIFTGNCRVKFNNNNATKNGGVMRLINNSAISIKANSEVVFDSNAANIGGAIFLDNQNDLTFDDYSTTKFNNNIAQFGGSISQSDIGTIIFKGNSVVNFSNNNARFGGAILSENRSAVIFKEKTQITFKNNTVINYPINNNNCESIPLNSGYDYDYDYDTYYKKNSDQPSLSFYDPIAECTITFNNGGSLYSSNSSKIIFTGTSSVMFNKNFAGFGGALYVESNSTIIFEKNSAATFAFNEADSGGAIYLTNNSAVLFKGNPFDISHNTTKAPKAIPIFCNTTNIGRFGVKFINNKAKEYGGAIFLSNKCDIKFNGTSFVTFINNQADDSGGALSCNSSSNIIFEENSMVKFIDNTAENDGGAIRFWTNSEFTFDENSTCKIIFQNNSATQGGALYYNNNTNIVFGGQSTVNFTSNNAIFGGALYCSNSDFECRGNSSVVYSSNYAKQGGAVYSKDNCNVEFKENSNITFVKNTVLECGGAIAIKYNSNIAFAENCAVTFNSNTVYDGVGGAICTDANSTVTFKDGATLTFCNNSAVQGGVIYSSHSSSLTFNNGTMVSFIDGMAEFGGALNIYSNSHVTFQGDANSKVTFDNNKAIQSGGAIYLHKTSDITFKGNLTVKYHNNTATLGGAVSSSSNSYITFEENSTIIFLYNNAKLGGGMFTTASNITVTDSNRIVFNFNTALQDGGAMFLDRQFKVILTNDAEITFTYNVASDYGGAIYTIIDESTINFNITNIHFSNNHARTAGSSVFISAPTQCNSSCLHNSVIGISKHSLQNSHLNKHFTTSPRKLELHEPAYCINNYDGECDSYYVNNIMLGQEILIDACMYDYYDQPTSASEFLVTSAHADDQDYALGSKYVLIACNHTFQGITIIGNKNYPVLPFNYTMTIALFVSHISEMRIISVNLTVELSPCHPGFWYHQTTQKCKCYNTSDIIFCSGSSSTIKRGYWFGSVTGKPTVAFCPINYCNFTCCETTNGFYHLSPVRDNQCMLHRSGSACGNCEVDYTLSFDSAECVHVQTCTVGQTILLVTLIMLYWIAITVAVFVMMYLKVEIGYLYGITYYYSMVDILLNQNWYLSNELYTLINVMSSITKITPQFLGHFCLVKDMSGIDQQFVHFMHPLVVSFILVLISWLARNSRRLSSFISRGVIPFICFLLLLSYTSVATTSLLLMRPLTFLNVNKIFTYLSPDIEYFHGRHLAYSIAAVLITITIVIGLPFLLLFEPLLNRKINFTRIKPLLDQFQGCYKDKYRCFAGYYMMCRLAIIAITIVHSSDNFIARYLIITACVIIDLIHQVLRPYTDNYLNLFDGAILHLIILVSVLPLVEFFNSFNPNLVTGAVYVLLLLPFTSLIGIKILIHRRKIKKMIVYCSTFKRRHLNDNEVPLVTIETQPREISNGVTVDNNMKRMTTIVDV